MKKPCKVADLITEVEYGLGEFFRFSVVKVESQWLVVEKVGGSRDGNIRMMDGSKAGGIFPTFEKAAVEVQRIVDNVLTPLTRREIVHHFTKAWMRREEQGEKLMAFRTALLNHRWKAAAAIFEEQFSNYTREAIHAKVLLQISLKL